MVRSISRRDFLASGLVALGALAAGPGIARRVFAAPAVPGEGPYGPLNPPDENGLMLPDGFSSRIIATSGTLVAGTSYLWHTFPDGGATFATEDGGWVYVSNSEVPGRLGGAGAIRFDKSGKIMDAYSILTGTSSNCAGGPTPWRTWLSCEEADNGRVWECDPFGQKAAVVHPALGVFTHESAAVDPERKQVYLTEDESDGLFYRFTPSAYPDLSRGVLEAALVRADGTVAWNKVPDPSAGSTPTRHQIAKAKRFDGGEGTWYDDGLVYFTTKGDNRVWTYGTRSERIDVLYDAAKIKAPPLTGVDNVMVSKQSGDVFVAEDGGDLEIVMITPERRVSRLLKVTGEAHNGSEIAGPALDPNGKRLYFSSQRGSGRGITYEVAGPFRTTRRLPNLDTQVLGRTYTPDPTAPPPSTAARPSPTTAVRTPAEPIRTTTPSPVTVAAPDFDDAGGRGALGVGAAATVAAGAVAALAAQRARSRNAAQPTDDG